MPAMDRPWKRISPELGRKTPATTLKTVVFPAPFGPMRPAISPGFTDRSTCERAVTPPKVMMTSRNSSSAPDSSSRPVASVPVTSAPESPSLATAATSPGAATPATAAHRRRHLQPGLGPEPSHPAMGLGLLQLPGAPARRQQPLRPEDH